MRLRQRGLRRGGDDPMAHGDGAPFMARAIHDGPRPEYDGAVGHRAPTTRWPFHDVRRVSFL